MLNDLFRSLGPLVAAALVEKFERGEFRFDSRSGRWSESDEGCSDAYATKAVSIDALDFSQPAPEVVRVMGPMTVRIVQGDHWNIDAKGDSASAVRARLDGERLTLLRRTDGGGNIDRVELVVTMPVPRKLAMLGAGRIHADALASKAKLAIAGSGSIAIAGIDTERLSVKIAGSGRVSGEGRTEVLKISSAGSGPVDLARLDAGRADIAMAGSGSATFTCDGDVTGQMIGSGNLTVYGRARCSLRTMGSGVLHCLPRDDRHGDEGSDGGDPVTPPKPPKPPKTPGAESAPQKPTAPEKSAKPKKAAAKAATKRKKPAK